MLNNGTKRDYWPTNGWRSSTPEEQGVDSKKLSGVFDFIVGNQLKVHSVLIIRHGYILADMCFYPYTQDTMHDLASCTKSFTSSLVGIALDAGHIRSVRQSVLDFFSEREAANVDNRKNMLTVENLLTMSTGMACYMEPGEITLREMHRSSDWIQFILDRPMIEQPGTRFEYCSPGCHLLSAILQEATSMKALDFGRAHLFDSLGIADVIWPDDPRGISHGWGNMHITPHDMAKLGYLYLSDGCWDGRQILSSEYIKSATANQITPPDSYGYGYLWWLVSPQTYSAKGRGGQLIMVVPDSDMVIVTTGGASRDESRQLADVLESIALSVLDSPDPLPENPKGVALLESSTHKATLSREEPRPVPVLPQTARRISGLTWKIDANLIGIKALSLSFNEGEVAFLKLRFDDSTRVLSVGLDNVFRISPAGRFHLPAACKGFWKNEHHFVLHLDEIANVNNWQIGITFKGNRVTVEIDEFTWHPSERINGHLIEAKL